jgi:methylated-DNA-protein-cysteine methyltransferase related protein
MPVFYSILSVYSTLTFEPNRRRTQLKQKRETSHAYARIWRTVEKIPRGKVCSYGIIAAKSGFPRQPRLAGYALHNIPEGLEIPWHRVLNAQGKISLGGPSGKRQRELLEAEGILFRNGRVDMKRFCWGRKVDFRKP